MNFKLIVPTIIETQLTGFIGGIEKAHRGRQFRIEFHRNNRIVCTKDEKPIRWEKLPAAIRKAAHSGAETFKQS